MKKKLQIFVSSTYTDLKEERQAAVEAILKSGNIPAGMELFTAGDKSQLDTITRWIDDSDVYMLILGGRYGSIEPTTGNSYTEVEYDYAKSNNKPLFAVVISEKFLNEKIKKEGQSVIEIDNPQKYKQFKEKVLKNISEFYDSPKDIKLAVHETLSDFKERYSFTGWIPGDVENKIDELNNENEELRRELQNLKKQSLSNSIEKQESPKSLSKQVSKECFEEEFEEIYENFESKSVDYEEKGRKITYSINEFIMKNNTIMITGIVNTFNMSMLSHVLFYNVMPQLNLYELAEMLPVQNGNFRRFCLTSKGRKYVIFLGKKKKS